jgi:hypothetical protein
LWKGESVTGILYKCFQLPEGSVAEMIAVGSWAIVQRIRSDTAEERSAQQLKLSLKQNSLILKVGQQVALKR